MIMHALFEKRGGACYLSNVAAVHIDKHRLHSCHVLQITCLFKI